MTGLQAVIIAVVEGLTEFLPISSTAHIKFAEAFLGMPNNAFNEMFSVVIQFAAILSVVTIYYKKFFDFKNLSLYVKLLVAVVPALVFGALLKKHIDAALSNLTMIACVMIGGGVLLLFIDKLFANPTVTEEKQIDFKKAFIIGTFQVVSIILPGFSRSAATIIGGLSQKLTRSLAAEFSFFLAVPTMFAASSKSLLDVYQDNPEVLIPENFALLGVGAVVSYIVALLAIKYFIGFVSKNGFKVFGYYRIVAGLVLLVLLYQGVIK
ncbi:MAG: undecaprenyl-diphosphate phosphatase [Bacteroidetes bacterium]|nr:MAG: undecaprenyl-diphosphate phosphatase [Bacteroidota bacterium]TAE72644.1 MAG: undecaprenyl-diphosphate phosphatase [Bacteroidota bacterium]TAF92834.1 MAG: undecaprenyl-diphosphate phosphatase [Bacteroidota bacterium]